MKLVFLSTVMLALWICSASKANPGGTSHSITSSGRSSSLNRSKPNLAYFIDFYMETYKAVTPRNIMSSSDKVVLDAEGMSQLKRILTDRQSHRLSEFDNNKVRLYIQSGISRPAVLVDQQGTVLEDGKQYTLTPFAFVELEHLLNYSLHDKK